MAKRKVSVVKNTLPKGFKLPESYTSLVIGAIVVLIIGILFILFAKANRNAQTSSTSDESNITSDSDTSSTYTIKPGDDLWTISENVYKDGYKWVEIVKANKLENPGIIHVGNKLIIPTISPVQVTNVPQQESEITQNNSISENTYKIKEGDNLWDIAVRAYGDGYRWVEIAKVNNLEDPNLIFSNNVLKLPR